MTPYIHTYSVDVRSGRVSQRESAPFAEGDALADKYIVRLMDGTQAVDLTSAVITADVLRPDGKTVSVVGQTVDGAAEVTLDKYCYAVRGEVSITVRAVVGDMAQTLLCVHAMVSQTTTDLVVDNGLIGNLTELIQAIIGTGGGTGGTGGNIALDTTLTQAGMAADAAAVGQRIAEVEEKIPVVPEWAMQTTKPAYSAAEVGADAQGTASAAVDAHNADAEAHPVIRESIGELADRLNALADSDDTTLDQLSEIVAYIKNNKSLIDSITTGKVSTSDIVNNLTTNSSTKPLSAAQGVALKKLIDEIVVPTKTSQLENDSGYLTEHQDISGLLPRTELDTAIDTALAEAKESGEFDGPQGEKGDTGAQGPQGEKGETGKSAYQYAQDGGYTGTEAEFMTMLAKNAFNPADYGLPVLELTGDTTGMSKETAVTLAYAYGERSGSCTLKWQGSSSITYDKKNYTIKFDTAFEAVEGWGAQKKYCLKANFIDFSHARNIVSARIWGMMVKARSSVNATLAASPNYGAVNGFPCAIMLNGAFHGLYTFNVPKDGWMMGMGSGTQECILCADHSTATQFKGEALCDDSDFEIEYVTDEDNAAWVAPSVNTLINACINSDGSDLDTTIAQYLDWESAIDYYILVALLDGQDMTDKNYILATYDGVKWFFSAYDMDSTYGLKWDGSYFSKASYGDHTSFVNYANTHRLMELIKRFKTDALRARYAVLRADVLSESNIAREFERFACDIPSRALDEDVKVWPMLPCTTSNSTWQILLWLNRRLAYVDKWMDELPVQEEVTGPSYTNQVPISTDADGNVYNGTGYRDGYRLTDDWEDKAAEGYVATGLIPCKGSDTIRIKGVEWPQTDSVGCYVSLYDASKALLARVRANNTTSWLTPTYDDSTGIISMSLSSNSHASSLAYVRFSCLGSGADMIVTVNEEIT